MGHVSPKNSSTGVLWSVFDLTLKVLICVVYVTRAAFDDVTQPKSHAMTCDSRLDVCKNTSIGPINWFTLLWVRRSWAIWGAEAVLALISLTRAVVVICTSSRRKRASTTSFILELTCSLPFISTLVKPSLLKDLFVPSFLHCWLVKDSLSRLYRELRVRRSDIRDIRLTLLQHMLIFIVSVSSLVFISACSIQHTQRVSPRRPLTLSESFSYVLLTFWTIGASGFSPDVWLGRLLMIAVICLSWFTLPEQVAEIVSTYFKYRKFGHGVIPSGVKKQVTLCGSLSADAVLEFLAEFYSSPQNEEYKVVVLSPLAEESNLRLVLEQPEWAEKVVYIQGSCLKEDDLHRGGISQSEACFLMSSRSAIDNNKADRHTIIRSWAVKDFAPTCSQYIQLFKASNSLHIGYTDNVVCEDDMAYTLLAFNCWMPGVSTFVSHLIHARPTNGVLLASEQVQRNPTRNEIQHTQLQTSDFFCEYVGETFPGASADVYKRYGFMLLAVADSETPNLIIKLNPGHDYKLKAQDVCYYMAVSEDMKRSDHPTLKRSDHPTLKRSAELSSSHHPRNTLAFESRTYTDGSSETHHSQRLSGATTETALSQQGRLTIGSPPATIIPRSWSNKCHMLNESRPHCCLQWREPCSHRKDESPGQPILLATRHASLDVFSFLIPLRSNHIDVGHIRNIVLLLEDVPNKLFLDTLAEFPCVYYTIGALRSTLIELTIPDPSHLVVFDLDLDSDVGADDCMADANTIITVQTLIRRYPNTCVMTALNHASNLRFMHVNCHDTPRSHLGCARDWSSCDVSSLFDSGQVFALSTLRQLLYQSFTKKCVLNLVRLILNLDSSEGSGHLSRLVVDEFTLQKCAEFGQLYQELCHTAGEIPIAIYRTELVNNNKSHTQGHMTTVGTRSYVITNPAQHLKLLTGDIIYVLQPP